MSDDVSAPARPSSDPSEAPTHPWFKLHTRVVPSLNALSWDAFATWCAVNLWMADAGRDGVLPKSKLHAAVARRIPLAKAQRVMAELVEEGWFTDDGDHWTGTYWEQPDVEVWSDDTKRLRWLRANRLKRMGELKQAVKDRDRLLCRYCGIRTEWGADRKSKTSGTYDHVDPDGDNTRENLVIACRKCNGKKRDRTPEQAGMPLYRPGTTAEMISAGVAPMKAASAAQDPIPEPRAGADPDPTQVGPRSHPDHGPGPPCAPAQDRTEPDRTRIGSGSHAAAAGGERAAPSLEPAPPPPPDDAHCPFTEEMS